METNNSSSQDPTQNPNISYYLHLRENPGTILINLQLDDNNDHAWSRAMHPALLSKNKHALFSKNKHKFIDGTMLAPKPGTPLHETWKRWSMMVISWVTQTLSEQIAQNMVYIEDARKLWNDLCEHFSKKYLFIISYLLQEIHSTRQGEQTISKFYTDLKTLWEELEALRPTPDYECKIKCNCALTKHAYKCIKNLSTLCICKKV